jgi:hypothetical protein
MSGLPESGHGSAMEEAKRLLATFKYSCNRVPNMMCLTSYALALVLVACVKVRKAK